MKPIMLKILLYVLLPLLFGLTIYVLFRRNTWLHQNLFPFSIQKIDRQHYIAGDLLVYSLPDFLWCFSFSSSLILMKQYLKFEYQFFYPTVLLLLIGAECIQFLSPGIFTFDFWDLGAAVLAFLMSILFLKT
jgi:hypothetical protein